jgi:hypothetical protein
VTFEAAEGNITTMLQRYDMRREDTGWVVYDLWTGWPAVVRGVPMVLLEMEEADDLVDLLNRANDRRSPILD